MFLPQDLGLNFALCSVVTRFNVQHSISIFVSLDCGLKQRACGQLCIASEIDRKPPGWRQLYTHGRLKKKVNGGCRLRVESYNMPQTLGRSALVFSTHDARNCSCYPPLFSASASEWADHN